MPLQGASGRAVAVRPTEARNGRNGRRRRWPAACCFVQRSVGNGWACGVLFDVVLGWQMALALIPFLAIVVISPFLLRKRLDTLGSEDREALGDLNAFVVDTVQGLGEVLAFQQGGRRSESFLRRVQRHIDARLPFYTDLSRQTALLEIATGLGGLAVVVTGADLVSRGNLTPTTLPLLTLLLQTRR